MSANKIDPSLLSDPRVLARFQNTRQAENGETGAHNIDESSHTDKAVMPESERLEISPSAHKLVEMRELLDAGRAKVSQEEPARQEKMESVKRRLQSGVYGSAEVRDQVAGQLTGLLRGLDTLLE